MNKKLTDCFNCDASFKVEFDDEDLELLFCPSCGRVLEDKVELVNVDEDYYIEEGFDL